MYAKKPDVLYYTLYTRTHVDLVGAAEKWGNKWHADGDPQVPQACYTHVTYVIPTHENPPGTICAHARRHCYFPDKYVQRVTLGSFSTLY